MISSSVAPDPTPDLGSVSFKDTVYLQFNGLHAGNVLDYFSYSQFYDRSCDNEVVKMQSRLNNPMLLTLDAVQEQMVQMRGIQYEVSVDRGPSLFVITKNKRDSPTVTRTVAMYYVIEGTIYQAPNLWTLLSNHLQTGLYFVDQAFKELSEEFRWYPSKGYTWNIDDQFRIEQAKSQEKDKDEVVEVLPTLDFTARIHSLINTVAEPKKEDKPQLQQDTFQDRARSSTPAASSARSVK